MKSSPEVTCIVCQQVFCCGDCRWRHEQVTHDLQYDCPLCRGSRFLCQPDLLQPAFLLHLQEHLPLHCSKCQQVFTTMDDFGDIDKCTSLSELVDHSKSSLKVADERFDSLYEKIVEGEEVERNNKTAVITPIVRKKYLVDYEASDTEPEDGEASPKVSFTGAAAPKTPRLKRSATPHVKKLLLARQQAIDEEDRGSPDLDTGSLEAEMTTPNSRPQSLAAAALAVTTSTPTHASAGGWALFSTQTDSPLSEIEQADSPQPDNRIGETTDRTEPEPTEENTDQTEQSGSKEPKLKSIISSRRIGSAESAEQDTRTKRVKFADDTVFQPEPRIKRVFRKPKRMLTPGPTKARFNCNPRFQALINRFEHNAASTSSFSPHPSNADTMSRTRTLDTMARTPVNNRQETEHNVPRAIDFKDSPLELKNSPVVEENRDASFKSCMATPGGGIDSAITALSTNIAGSLQACITNVLKQTEEETEIQFKFTITKKKTVQRAQEDTMKDQDKENLWATVAKAVKNAFWGEGGEFETPHKSISSCSSSSSKRKQPDRSRSPSPVNGSWGLPAFVCDVYIAMDVTSSTSSIFNLVAISIDRYIAVTQPIKYAKHKNNRRVWFTIVLVWLISAAIGTPVVLGLNDTPDRNYGECLFNSQNYVIYSSLGSFYIPCIMMMFLYYSIFKALRIRARKQRAAKKPPMPEDSQAVVIENVAQTRRLAETALDAATNTGSGSNEDDHDSFDKRSVELEDAEDCHVIPNDKSTEFMLAAREDPPKTLKSKLKSDPNGNNDSGYAPSSVEPASSPPNSPAPAASKNGTRLDESRNASLAIRSEDEPDTVSQFGDCKKERKASAATARFTIYKANKASKKKREKSSAKKERKATKTLAIVLGVFLFCWAPFFTCSVLDAVCFKLGLPYSPGVTVFMLTTWLGYINSFLNPVIYTIFNPEFRKAFRKILHCGT